MKHVSKIIRFVNNHTYERSIINNISKPEARSEAIGTDDGCCRWRQRIHRCHRRVCVWTDALQRSQCTMNTGYGQRSLDMTWMTKNLQLNRTFQPTKLFGISFGISHCELIITILCNFLNSMSELNYISNKTAPPCPYKNSIWIILINCFYKIKNDFMIYLLMESYTKSVHYIV